MQTAARTDLFEGREDGLFVTLKSKHAPEQVLRMQVIGPHNVTDDELHSVKVRLFDIPGNKDKGPLTQRQQSTTSDVSAKRKQEADHINVHLDVGTTQICSTPHCIWGSTPPRTISAKLEKSMPHQQ
jgi:hypothetical protein